MDDAALDTQDKIDCLLLFLGRAPQVFNPADFPAASVDALVRDICDSGEFREGVLAPLMLHNPLPQARIADAPPFKLIDWAQRRLPLTAQTRRSAGAARSWTDLLELLLSDDQLLALLPDFREAQIGECLSERVAQGSLARAQRSVVGSIDGVSAFEISGWALDVCDKSKPVTLEFYADNLFIGSVLCVEPRPDVQETMGGAGACGFHYRIAPAHRPSLAHGRTIAALDAVSRVVVGAPTLVYADPSKGWDTLHAARRELSAMRKAIERIEAQLPDLSRLASTPLDAYEEYWERFYRMAPDVLEEQRKASKTFGYQPLISIIMPAWNSHERLLGKAIESVLAQTYSHWELIVSDDASPLGEALSRCRRAMAEEPRIHWRQSGTRMGISGNTNFALTQAAGEYVAFLDHDDELTPDALFQVVSCLQRRRYGLVYSDEDRIEDDALGTCRHHTPFFKPGFDPDLLRSMNYICHLVVLRRELVTALGGLRDGYDGAQDHDLLLRASSVLAESDIHHIARILYHWRVTPDSVSRVPGQYDLIQSRIVAAVNSQLGAGGLLARAEAHRDPEGSDRPFATRIRWSLPQTPPSVAIIVPTRDRLDLLRPCLDSVLDSAGDYPGRITVLVVDNDSAEATTLAYFAALSDDPRVRVIAYPGAFNWSAINNFAARQTDADVLIFLNNDTIVRTRDWVAELAGNAVRPDVGAVGARLLYSDGTIQHAGVVLGVEGVAGHDSVGEAPHDGGYFGRSHVLRSAAAVTGACLATPRRLFEQVGGFDEVELKVAFNDIDYCMKVRHAGLRVVYDPFVVLFHFESKSRGRELTHAQQSRHSAEAAAFRKRWGDGVGEDPYYNAHFERYARPFDRLRPPALTSRGDRSSV
jgi:GT2 family glycosyltransferase